MALTEHWRKPDRSAHNGNCVEICYRTSSHSGISHCVEVADGCGTVHVRDSKNPGGPQLSFSPGAWRAFIGDLKGHPAQGMN